MLDREHLRESERLDALREYRLLDSPGEQAYDDITRLAAFICGVPIALVSLIDERRQWFKSRVGIDVTETPRELAFCAHTIQGQGLMVVPDATLDDRFASNPLVTGAPGIRFYAGAPLVTPSGFGIGTLCAIDQQPRTMSEKQLSALEALARQLMALLELRRTTEALAGALGRIEVLEGLVPICSYCKNVRDDKGYWSTVETFLAEQSDFDLTHGICPKCFKKEFGEDLNEPAT